MSISKVSSEKLSSDPAKKSSLCSKIKFALNNITVEPIIFFHVIASLMGMITNQNLALEKTCRVNLRFNESICDAITKRNNSGYTKAQEAEIQALVQQWEAYKAFVVGTIPVIMVIFLGTWSDRHGKRKPLILMPLFGGIVSNVLLLVCAIYFMELKMQYSWMAELLPNTFSGGIVVMFLGIFSYVGGLGDEESKTIRIGTITMAQTIAMSIGTFLSGIVLHHVGFKGIYVIVILVMSACFLYGLYMIKEQEILPTGEEKVKESTKEMFALKHVKNTFVTCFRNEGGTRRKKMIIIMMLSGLTIGPMLGEVSIIYLSVRLRFGWNEVDYSVYNSWHFIVQLIGNTFALTVLCKYLKLRDVTLGIIAMCSKISAAVIYAFAPTGMFFYIGAVAEIFNGTNHIALRAIMSKIVPPNELGQSNSVFGICEGVAPVIFGPLYSFIYIKTIMIFPGAIFLVSTCFNSATICLYIWLYKATKTEEKVRLENLEQVEVVEELLQKDTSNGVNNRSKSENGQGP